MGKDSRYWAGRYAGSSSFKFQGVNKPKPPTKVGPERHYTENYCGDPHCWICKAPVENEPHGGFCGDVGCSICNAFMILKKPITSRHYTNIITDDLTEDELKAREGASHKPSAPKCDCSFCRAVRRTNEKIRHQKSKKEVNMCEDDKDKDFENQTLYEVITTYGGDRENVVVERTEVVAENEKRALMQAKDDVNSSWDMDYVEQYVNCICNVRVKRKPREILKG